MRVVSIGEKPGLQTETKNNRYILIIYSPFSIPHPMRHNNHATARTRLIVYRRPLRQTTRTMYRS